MPWATNTHRSCQNFKAWDHFKAIAGTALIGTIEVDLHGKRVTIIGSAAAAVQIVPELAKVVEHLSVLQRSPNWILPRNNKTYSEFRRVLCNRFPGITKLVRRGQGFLMSFMHEAALMGSKRMDSFENMGRKYIKKAIKDPEIQKAVTPDSRFGCKRPLVSDDFYPALNRDNVTLIASAAQEITETGVRTADGELIESDVIVYCTGYRVLDFDRIEVTGKNGQDFARCYGSNSRSLQGYCGTGIPQLFPWHGPQCRGAFRFLL